MLGMQGAKPLAKNNFGLPLPAGKGVGGMGAKTKLKAGATGDQKGKPPSGTTAAGVASAAGGKPPQKNLPHQSQYPANAPSRYTAERKTPEPSRRAKTSSPEEGSPVYVYASRKLPAPAA